MLFHFLFKHFGDNKLNNNKMNIQDKTRNGGNIFDRIK